MMEKVCSCCKTIKPATGFYRDKRNKDGLSYSCRRCLGLQKERWKKTPTGKAYLKRLGESYAAKNRARTKKNKTENKKVVRAMKNSGCVICGETESVCLDFHHPDPSKKVNNVASLLTWGRREAAIKEAEKCIVVCANCHRKIHAGIIRCPDFTVGHVG